MKSLKNMVSLTLSVVRNSLNILLCRIFGVCLTILPGTMRERVTGALLGLRQFLTSESPLKMIKNAFYCTLKTIRSQETYFFVLTFLALLYFVKYFA